MLKHLPKILVSSVALFGMLTNLYLIDALSDNTAASGVEELLSLRMWDWSRSVTRYTDIGGFISFSLIGAVAAAYVARKRELSLKMTLLSIVGALIVSGFVLGNIQNEIVSNIGTTLVKKYPEAAKRAISTYYVQRVTWRDNEFKNVLIPTYTGTNINTAESELFRVNMFYLVEDPLLVIGDKARGKDLMGLYFFDAIDAQLKREPWNDIRDNFIFEGFVKKYQTPQHDLRRIHNAAVMPILMAVTIFSLILSVIVFTAQLLGFGGGHWIKVRLLGVLGVILALLVTPVFINTDYHLSPAVQELKCSYTFCNVAKPAVDWLFRFELGVVKLISLVI